MDKGEATGNAAGRRWEHPSARWAVVALALCSAYPVVRAAPLADAGMAAAQANQPQPLRLQVEASTLPRLDAQDHGFQAPRVDISVFPGRKESGLAAVFGVSGFNSPTTPAMIGLPPLRPSFDVGLRWTQRLQSQRQIDITAWRRMTTDDDAYSLIQQQQPTYGARFELNLTPVRKTGFALDRGFIGLQLSGGARITVKRSNGHPMIYYRTSF